METISLEDINTADKTTSLEMRLMKQDALFSPIWTSVVGPIVDSFSVASCGAYSTYDVFLSIHSGASLLYVGNLNDARKTFAGFVVLELLGSRIGGTNDGPNVWLSYIDPSLRGTQIVFEGAAFIEAEAKKLGAKAIYAVSNNDEIGALFEKIGFSKVVKMVTYRKDL